MPSQAGSVLSAVPGAFSTEPARSEDDRTKVWALLIACGYGGDCESSVRLTRRNSEADLTLAMQRAS